MVAWVVIDRQHLRQTSPSLFPCSHSHFGCHASRIPEEIIPFFSCTYVEPILQPLCFHIHVCNGGVPPPQPATFKPSNVQRVDTLLLPLLTFHRISSQMVIPKETASLDRTTNEHPRCHYRQAHQDQRRTRRANRGPRRHTHLRPGCAQFRRLRPGSRSQLVDSTRPARRAVHHSHQRGHHYAAGHRLLFLSPDNRRLPHRRRLLH